MSNLITVDGGAAGASRFDRTAGVAVALSAPLGYTTYAWSLLAYPEAVAPTFSAPSSRNTNLTPTAGYAGRGWRVRLIVDAGLATEDSDIVVIGVPHATYGWIIAPAGVTQSEYDVSGGWWNKTHGVEKILADVMAGVVSGGTLAINSITHTPAYTLSDSHNVVLIDNSGGNPTINLPDPSTRSGKQWVLKITGTSKNPVSLVRFGTEQINGRAGTRILRAPHGTWTLICDGTDWHLLGKNRLDLVFTADGSVVVEAGWRDAEAYVRPGAGGGGGGGGGANAAAGTTGGGGGKGGGGGAPAVGARRPLILPAAGTTLDVTVGVGGVGGTAGPANSTSQGGAGGDGEASEISVGGVPLLRAAHALSLSVGGGGGGGTGGAGTSSATGASTGGGGATAANAFPNGWGTASVGGANGGSASAGATGSAGSAANPPSTSGSPWRADTMASPNGGQGGAAAGGQGGGGGGGTGGGSTYADEFSPDGTPSATTDGRGGGRTTTEGNGGAGNAGGTGNPGVAGANGIAGTNGRGGGGGQGGGGGGSGSGGGGAGGAGGVGGAGSDGVVVLSVWE